MGGGSSAGKPIWPACSIPARSFRPLENQRPVIPTDIRVDRAAFLVGRAGPAGRLCADPGSPGATSEWRNWQTRQLEGLVPARAWGFKSPLRHHTSLPTTNKGQAT